MTVETGHFDVLRRSFSRVSDDQRIQAVLIAFSFGALLEALAGFGTPVAVTSVMLMALGFKPMKAAVLALVANTAPVAFGAMATPILTLAKVTELPVDTLGAMVGRQTPILAVFVPLVLVAIVDGWRGIRETWPAAVVCGLVFGVAQFATSNFISVPLADVVASLLSAAAVVAAGARLASQPHVHRARRRRRRCGRRADARFRRARRASRLARRRRQGVRALRDHHRGVRRLPDHRREEAARQGDCQVPVARAWTSSSPKGKPVTLTEFTLNLLTTPGTQMLIAGVLTAIVLKLSVPRAVKAYGTTLHQLRWAILTVMAVLALAFVMNLSGQTITLGTWMAAAGGAFALLSPILGWLGVAVTGSDTSANSLFGALQVTAANQAGLSDILMAASNSSGGVLGKMISPQNLAIAAAAVGMNGKEGDIFRRVVVWSLLFLLLMCILSALQASPVLSWMVPS